MSHLIRPFLAVLALAFAAPVAAQESLSPDSANTGASVATVISPSASTLTASPKSNTTQEPMVFRRAFATPSVPTALAPPALAVQRTSDNVALMIVGGAGLLVGAVVGGDEGSIIMIVGGSVGLLGLYRYLR